MNWGWLPKHRQGHKSEDEHEQEDARFNIDNYFFKFFKKGLMAWDGATEKDRVFILD